MVSRWAIHCGMPQPRALRSIRGVRSDARTRAAGRRANQQRRDAVPIIDPLATEYRATSDAWSRLAGLVAAAARRAGLPREGPLATRFEHPPALEIGQAVSRGIAQRDTI